MQYLTQNHLLQMPQVIFHKVLERRDLGGSDEFRGAARLPSRAGREDKASKRTSICPCNAGAYGLANRIILILGDNGPRSRAPDRSSSPERHRHCRRSPGSMRCSR